MPVERQLFRDAMSRLGAAVNIITTGGPAGRAGFTASAVCSVTDQPPTLLVCMNKGVSGAAVFERNAALCVNTLCARHEGLSSVFAGMAGVEGEARFAAGGGGWGELATGAPVLADAAVAFDCRISDTVEKGTHRVLFCEVEAVRLGAGDSGALFWFARGYRVMAA
jgi:flavin reductase